MKAVSATGFLVLLKAAKKIKNQFPRQFYQIINRLCNSDAQTIIKTVNELCHQITQLNVHCDFDLASFSMLTENDFWVPFS